jgi:uncharacterized protein YbjT (DUF2867 family)
MILITGASGNVGGAVLSEAMKTREKVRAMYRSEADAAKAPAGVEAVVADFSDRESLRRALRGVETVFLVCSPIPDLVKLESSMVDACKEADVRRIVKNSAMGAGEVEGSFPNWHKAVENRIEQSGIAHTILRPDTFMQNIPAFYAPTIRTQGAFFSASKNSHIGFIDVRDIAAVAVKALTLGPQETRSDAYELTGPEGLTYADLAARISRVAGRPVQYVDLPPAELKKGMLGSGMPEWQAEALIRLVGYYTSRTREVLNDNVKKILGREARNMDDFLRENADAFREQAARA